MEPLTSRTHTLEGGSGQFAGGRFLCRFSRQDWIAALGCGLVALVVYLLTLAPTVTAEDSGELIAAAYTLGIPHAPGYPLFVLLAKGFVTVFPFGEVAWRVNLFTAMMGGLSVALLVLLCRRLSAGLAASISLSLAAAFSSIFWSQAIMAEVYTLSTAAFLLVLHLLVLFFLDPTATRLWILAYAFGLSLTAHPSMILLAPGLLLGVGLRDRRIFRRPGQLLIGMLFFALGFSVFLYLPLRSLADPVMDWGNPETVSGFFGHLLRRQYAGLSDTPGQSLLNYPLYLGHLAFYEVGPVFVILSLLGAQAVLGFPGEGDWPFERKSVRRAFGITSAFLVVSYSAGLLFFISVSFQKATLALNSVFFIPLLFLLAVPSALGLDRLAARLAARLPERMRLLPRKQAGWAAAAAIPLAFLLANYRGNDKSDYRIARDYAENILRTLPKDSIYMPGGDHANFPVIYLQVVEGKRPDVTVADRYGYLDPAFLKRLGLDEGELKRVRSMPRSEADRFVIDRVGKPVLVNSKRSILELPTERFLPFGLLYRVDRERSPLSREEEDRLWESYTFSNLGKDFSWKRGARDIAADYILVEVLSHQVSRLFQRGDADGALKTLESLRQVASGYKEALQNAGSLLVEEKRVREAASFYEAALRLDPHYRDCRLNYAQSLLASSMDLEKAVELADRSLREIEPDGPFLKDLARAYRKLKRFRNAKDALFLAMQVAPLDPEPSRMLGEIEEEDLNSKESAREYYAQSLRLKPTQPDLIEKLEGREARQRYEEAAQKAMEAMMDPRLPVAAGIQ